MNTPEPIVWLESDSRTRHLFFPMASKAARVLRELGMENSGFDLLHTRYRAGTDCSATHLLYFCCEGEIGCDSGGGIRTIRKNEVAICPAGTPHWISIESGRSKGMWIHLHAIGRWNFLGSIGPCIRPAREIGKLAFALEQGIAEGCTPAFGAFENTCHYAAIVGVLLLRELDQDYSAQDRQAREKLERLWAEVAADLQKKWTVAEMASRIHVSPGYLHQLAAKYMGLAPIEVLTRLRMERAMDLLLHNDDTIEAVAAEVGYNSAFSFSEAFLRETGRRPGAFRSRKAR